MLNLIPLVSQSPPLDGLLVKSQSNDLDTSQSPSFGEILKARAKQKQKEAENSALSGVAGMVTSQPAPPVETHLSTAQSASINSSGSISDQADKTAEVRDAASAQSSSRAAQSQAETEKLQSDSNQAAASAEKALGASEQTGTKSLVDSPPAQEAAVVTADPLALSPAAVSPQVDDPTAVSTGQAGAQVDQSPAVLAAATDLTGKPAAQAAVLPVSDPALEAGAAQAAAPTEPKKNPESLSAVSGDSLPDAQAAAAGLPQVDNKQPAAALPANLPSKAQAGSDGKGVGSAEAPKNAIPAETQPETNPALAAMTNASGLTQETSEAVTAAGKMSTPPVNLQATDVIQQIMRQMSVTIQSGPSSMRLQLNPKELGAIDVQMVKNAQGLSVTFFAEQASTGRLLETQINQLRQSLTDSGIQLSNLNIGQNGQFGQQSGSFRQAPQFTGYPSQSAAQTETKTEVDNRLRIERLPGQMLGVDYRV